jgi:hypothetical protein
MEGPYFHSSHVDGFLPEEATAYDLGHRLVCGKSFFLSFLLMWGNSKGTGRLDY